MGKPGPTTRMGPAAFGFTMDGSELVQTGFPRPCGWRLNGMSQHWPDAASVRLVAMVKTSLCIAKPKRRFILEQLIPGGRPASEACACVSHTLY